VKLIRYLRELWRGPRLEHISDEESEASHIFKARVHELQTKRLMSSQLTGDYASAFLGQGLSFSELREYQCGDEPRLIHWGATARIGKPFVKLFKEERQLRLIILLDTSPSMMMTSRKEKALEFASLLISVGQKNRDLVGFCSYGAQLHDLYPPGNSRPHYRQVLLALQTAKCHREVVDFEQISTGLREKLKQRSVLIFLSDFEDAKETEGLSLLVRMHDVLCVHIPGEAPSKEHGLMKASDPETGVVRLLDSSLNSPLYREAQQREAGHFLLLSEILGRAGVELVRYRTNALATLDEIAHSRRGRRH